MVHNVYFWLRSGTPDEEIRRFEKGLEDFLSAVDEIAEYQIGKPAATPEREVTNHDFVFSIFVHFKSVSDHDKYQEHPAHQVFIDSFSMLWSKVSVLDSELIKTSV